MKPAVTIKSFPNGLKLILNDEMPFEELYVAFAQKLIESDRFLGDAKLVITFEGRELSDLEERALIEAFGEYSHVNILCVMEKGKKQNEVFIQAANAFSPSGKSEDIKTIFLQPNLKALG